MIWHDSCNTEHDQTEKFSPTFSTAQGNFQLLSVQQSKHNANDGSLYIHAQYVNNEETHQLNDWLALTF